MDFDNEAVDKDYCWGHGRVFIFTKCTLKGISTRLECFLETSSRGALKNEGDRK